MGIRIITDSTADYPLATRNQVSVVPLTVKFGSKEYIDGVTITHEEFYRLLKTEPELPTTSQATPDSFDRCFREAVAAGDSAIVITIASQMSGTCQSAAIAAAEYPGKVFVVDSRNVSIGAGLLATLALQLVQEGKSAESIAETLCRVRERIRILAVVDTLEYLKRGGRISKAAAVAGGILSIKPLIEVKNGEINAIGKARGARQAMQLLLKSIDTTGGIDFSMPAILGYSGCDTSLLENFRQECSILENGIASLPATEIGSVVGTHAGPGAYAAAFFVN